VRTNKGSSENDEIQGNKEFATETYSPDLRLPVPAAVRKWHKLSQICLNLGPNTNNAVDAEIRIFQGLLKSKPKALMNS